MFKTLVVLSFVLFSGITGWGKTVGLWKDERSEISAGMLKTFQEAGWQITILTNNDLSSEDKVAGLDVIFLPGGWNAVNFADLKARRNLVKYVAGGQFLADLMYRLRVVTIRVPPLRERPEDIQPLAEHFIAQACREHGRAIESVAPGYMDALLAHSWPGNVRELRNAVESSVILAAEPVLRAGDLQFGAPKPAASAAPDLSGRTLADLEKQAIIQALERHGGARSLAAAALGVSTRTIQRKIREYQLPNAVRR